MGDGATADDDDWATGELKEDRVVGHSNSRKPGRAVTR
jgi:hypothetical protein